MMLAVRLEWDVLEQHNLVVAADFMENTREVIGRIFEVALAIFLPRARNALGRIEQAFALGIVACPAEDGAHGLFHLGGHGNLPPPLQHSLVAPIMHSRNLI
jgi:hypothetical protein